MREVCREPVVGPGRGLEVKRMLSLCCRPQVNSGLMVSKQWLPHWEFQMWHSDPNVVLWPGSQCTHLLWS